MYIFLIPYLARSPRNWSFFMDQSPWIWLCYAVLLLSGLAAHWHHSGGKRKALARQDTREP